MFRQGLVFALAIGLLATASFSQPKLGERHGPEVNPCFLSVNPVGPVVPGEPTRLEACIRSEVFLDTILVVFTPEGAIQYSGQTEWRQVVNAGDSIVFPLEVTFAKNDTAGFEVTGFKNGLDFIGSGYYVVSTGDSIKTFKFDPRKLPKETTPPSSEGYLREPHDMPPHDERGDTVKSTTYMLTEWEQMKEKERNGIDVAGYGMTVHELSKIVPGEPAQLEVYIYSDIYLDTLTFKIVPDGTVLYHSQAEWRQVVNAGDTLTFPLEVIFLPNDTSGFEVTTTRGGAPYMGTGFYAVTTCDSVKTTQVDPRKLLVGAGEPYSKEYLEVLKNSPPQAGWNDTIKGKASIQPASDWERMQVKERAPLTGKNAEVIKVDGKPWIRHPGETKFQPLAVITDRDSLMTARQEQLHEKKMRSDFDVIIDLRDSSAYAFVRDTLGWSLQPMDSAGYYRTTQSGKALLDLDSRGILHNPYPRYPHPMHYRTPEQQRVYDSIREEKRLKSLKKSQESKESKHHPL